MTRADDRYQEMLERLEKVHDFDWFELDQVVGERLVEAAALQPEPDDDEAGYVVVCLNRRGVAEAFGPYGEMEAHEVATFAKRLVPTWMVNCYERTVDRYGVDTPGGKPHLPRAMADHPTRSDVAWPTKATEPSE